LTSDHLGSTRLVTDGTGTVLSRHDYFPFGEEIYNALGNRNTDPNYNVLSGPTQRFTAKERDNESGLDFFLARYYSGAQGRFTSPDEFTGGPHLFTASALTNPTFFADLNNPQTLNKYVYCINNPLAYVDPDGHELIVAPDIQTTVSTLRQQSPSLDAELAAHEGSGPDLYIQYGATPNDPNGQPSIGNASPQISITGVEPMPAPFQVWDDGTRYGGYKGATITINNTIRGNSERVEGTLAHEVGHVNDARTNTDVYGKQAYYTKQTHGATDHDKRPEEITANKFKMKVKNERDQFKEQQKREQKLEKERKKQHHD
jgi:RHS repeat-associated protein